MFHVQVAAPPWTAWTRALRRALPTRPTHVTLPFRTAAPVSERAATRRSVKGFPAAGFAGCGLRLFTTSVGGVIFTS
jgi:hypothetical protein